MENDMLFLVDLAKLEFSETGGVTGSWVHALAPGEYQHPVYGPMKIDDAKIKGLAESVKTKVRGVDPSINYKHEGDGEAAGWVKDAEARPDGLWTFVEWTTDAVRKIKDKAFKYFSAEYKDTWTDPQGVEHKDVVFGGALTNRPYMKNLIPVNLSESVVDLAFGLTEAITEAKKAHETGKEDQVDLTKLNELLGLPAGTSEEDALKKFAELTKPADKDKTFPAVPKGPAVSAELVALAEDNPIVANLLETMAAQQEALKAFNENLLEKEIATKLAEFDQSKIILTPKAKDMVHDLLVDMPISLHEAFWEIMAQMRKSNAMMVELGERGGADVRYGRAKDKKSLFMDEVARVALSEKISQSDAVDKVARANPELYAGYRTESYIGATE